MAGGRFPTADWKSLGRSIRRLRKERGLNQAQLSELAGISAVTISQIENGLTNPAIGTVEMLAKALSTSVPALYLSRTDQPRRTDEALINTVSKNIDARRTYLGLSSAEMAQRAELSQSYVSKIKHARLLPKVSRLVKLARALGVQPSWLLAEAFDPAKAVPGETSYIHVHDIAARIFMIREGKGLTVLGASQLAGWHPSLWYELEGKRRDYALLTVLTVCDVLGAGLSDLIDETD
nr:helix-turn-helix transcriptional regulator [Ruegeria atlantica]